MARDPRLGRGLDAAGGAASIRHRPARRRLRHHPRRLCHSRPQRLAHGRRVGVRLGHERVVARAHGHRAGRPLAVQLARSQRLERCRVGCPARSSARCPGWRRRGGASACCCLAPRRRERSPAAVPRNLVAAPERLPPLTSDTGEPVTMSPQQQASPVSGAIAAVTRPRTPPARGVDAGRGRSRAGNRSGGHGGNSRPCGTACGRSHQHHAHGVAGASRRGPLGAAHRVGPRRWCRDHAHRHRGLFSRRRGAGAGAGPQRHGRAGHAQPRRSATTRCRRPTTAMARTCRAGRRRSRKRSRASRGTAAEMPDANPRMGPTYEALVEQALVGVYVVQDGRIVYANPRLARVVRVHDGGAAGPAERAHAGRPERSRGRRGAAAPAHRGRHPDQHPRHAGGAPRRRPSSSSRSTARGPSTTAGRR